MKQTDEKAYELAIESHLTAAGGYAKARADAFQRDRSLDPAVFLAFTCETQYIPGINPISCAFEGRETGKCRIGKGRFTAFNAVHGRLARTSHRSVRNAGSGKVCRRRHYSSFAVPFFRAAMISSAIE